jgi:hypothetical protein
MDDAVIQAVWVFDGVRVLNQAEALLHLIAHELVHAILHVVPLPAFEENTAARHAYHTPSFMRLSRGLFGHSMVGPANAHDNMQLCTVSQLAKLSTVDESVSAGDCMQLLWKYNGTPPLLNLQELLRMRRAAKR